jgi:hypothetical protein
MRCWLSVLLRLGRRLTCGAGNSTADYATLVFSVAPPWPTSHMWSWQQHHRLRHGLCYAGFQCRSSLADAQHIWSWQQHHRLCDAGFQCRSTLADIPYVELATALWIMQRRFSVAPPWPTSHMWSWQQHHRFFRFQFRLFNRNLPMHVI